MDLVVKVLSTRMGDAPEEATMVVGFFEGCVASVMGADVHHKAAELLCAAGADVVSPPNQWCCGAIHHHNGDVETAREMARHNIDTYLPDGADLDYIVTCVAGDGAMLRQYGELLEGDPAYAERAQRFSDKVRDVTEVLAGLGLPEIKKPMPQRVTYHDACHLCHGQGVTAEPRELLKQVPGLELVPLDESAVCCGAAGTYNITQPEMAQSLADRKLGHVKDTGCETVVSGNIGCNLHLQSAANRAGIKARLRHPVEVLHDAVFGQKS